MVELGDVLQRALRLSLEDRAALAERLLASLDALDEEEAERLWTAEAVSRLEDLRGGRTQPVSADQVREDAERLTR